MPAGGLKLYILNKIKDAYASIACAGKKNNTSVSYIRLAQVKDMPYLAPSSLFKYRNSYNLSFKNKFHTKVRASKRIGPHNEEVISVIIGSLLGDGYANARTIEGTRICFRQSVKHMDYLFWLYDFFYTKGYCSNLKPRKYLRKLQNKEYYGYEFNTFTFRSFNWIHKLFYKKGTKYVNLQLEKYLTPLALAIWIMDDGCWTNSGVRIATNCFNLEEVKSLVCILIKLYNINCTIQKVDGRYSIYITKQSISILRSILLPYILPSMKYKLGLNNTQV
nr:hypothetical protein [Ophiocordyceps sp.]